MKLWKAEVYHFTLKGDNRHNVWEGIYKSRFRAILFARIYAWFDDWFLTQNLEIGIKWVVYFEI